ncbi:MAG TPA: GNAT family N-acetyltransferase [Candidatus Babeliales bacterium]|nr:GNAT family N-acetyltransferase [Candidatus Babeliales bacterium]
MVHHGGRPDQSIPAFSRFEPALNVERDGFIISSDPGRFDFGAIERLLRSSYWAGERSRQVIELSIKNSLCFGLYRAGDGKQIGFTRVVTDSATFAWICDVIVDPAYRGRGLGSWMMGHVLSDPDLRCVRRWILATRDAHDFYAVHGFTPLANPDRWMERVRR